MLLAPAMRVGGHGWAVGFMMALAALVSVQTLRLALACSAWRLPAVLAWVAVAFTPPMLLYAPLIYPEVAGALCSATLGHVVVSAWRTRRLTWGTSLEAAAALSALPWLHLRYLPIILAFALALVVAWWRAGRARPAGALLAGAPAAAWAALLALNWRLFGGVPAVDEYGTVGLAQALTGAPGLLFDRQFGLLPYAPGYVLALAGIALLPRAVGRGPAIALLLPAAAYVAFIACFSYWYGAFSPPARMLVPIVPLLAAPLAAGLAAAPVWRWLWGALLAMTWGVAHLLLIVPRLRYNLPDGHSALLVYLSEVWGHDVTGWLPSFIVPTVGGYVWVAAAVGLASVVLARLGGFVDLTPDPSPYRRGELPMVTGRRRTLVEALRSRLSGVG
jgi:hypothetical protein